MSSNQNERSFAGYLRTTLATGAILGAAATVAPGCLDRPLEPQDPRLTSTIVERLTQSAVDKIDLLLVIDNSGSMADKQEILQAAVPDLVRQLVNPLCVDDDGNVAQMQPTDPLADCPIDGTTREFEPIVNFHLGILTSSLGGHGADTCNAQSTPSENDKGHLINRSGTGVNDPVVAGWNGTSFLVWDPSAENPSHEPQGQTDIDTLIADLSTMVGGAGEVGCGFEAPLEAWYRFLIDPDPYDTVTLEGTTATLNGTDNVLLQQRTEFLRPDSLLAIIMLTDENDCSIRDGGQFYFAAQSVSSGNQYHLPKPRAACATDPNSPCCRSCGQSAGCEQKDGDTCVKVCDESQDDCSGSLSQTEDHINLRCFDQKRRFGIDFLYPISRYVTGVTAQQVQNRFAQAVPNPLFTDLNPNDENNAVRDAGLVFVAGIVGVPWQDIARRDANGVPDLIGGLNLSDEMVGGFQDGNELIVNGTWDVILGDPANYVPPTDPLMIESVGPRSGANPITGDVLQPPGAGNANPINGSEYTIASNNDLQYACIFDLVDANQMPVVRDCNDPNVLTCDCDDANNDNPLCDPMTPTNQVRAKAYPGIRELQLLKDVKTQGIVGSICPAQLTDLTASNFGYRPAIQAIVDRLKQALGGQCLPRSLTPNEFGQVQCRVLEARKINSAGECAATCDVAGRQPIDQAHPAVEAAKDDPLAATAGWNCFCEITQTTGEDLAACQSDTSDAPVNASGAAVHGWCYVDASTVPPTGNPDIVASCPPTENRIIRFVGEGQGVPGATLFITCSGE